MPAARFTCALDTSLVLFDLGMRLHVCMRMRTKLENGILRNGQQLWCAVNGMTWVTSSTEDRIMVILHFDDVSTFFLCALQFYCSSHTPDKKGVSNKKFKSNHQTFSGVGGGVGGVDG